MISENTDSKANDSNTKPSLHSANSNIIKSKSILQLNQVTNSNTRNDGENINIMISPNAPQ